MYSSGKFNDISKEELILELNQITANYDSLKQSYTKLKYKKSETENRLTKRQNELQGIYRDVTELIRHEDELIKAKEKAEKNEYRYRKAQEVGHIGSWEYNLQNDTFWGSDEGKRIYNLDLKIKEFPVEDVMNCVVEEDRNRVNQALVDLITENKPYDIVFTIVPKNTNEEKIIHSNAEVLRDKNNNPVMVTGVLQDITLQKHFEKELIRAKEKAEENESRIHTQINTILVKLWLGMILKGVYLQCLYKRFEDSLVVQKTIKE